MMDLEKGSRLEKSKGGIIQRSGKWEYVEAMKSIELVEGTKISQTANSKDEVFEKGKFAYCKELKKMVLIEGRREEKAKERHCTFDGKFRYVKEMDTLQLREGVKIEMNDARKESITKKGTFEYSPELREMVLAEPPKKCLFQRASHFFRIFLCPCRQKRKFLK